jgi:hydrogenase maturation protein HypF
MPGAVGRRAIHVRGIVQGVGFRPHVYGLARRHHLGGVVRNALEGVSIEVEGDEAALDEFARALVREAPPLARIAGVSSEEKAPLGEKDFRIEGSEVRGEAAVFVAPDTATCKGCLRELFDPSDRRFRYPFLNCTSCGPRLTIVTEAPYDRDRTTMASFVLCAACRREYEDPLDRRFHAQPTACPDCGPRLVAHHGEGSPLTGDPLDIATRALEAGKVVALKGLGGYHLACDARSEASVAKLRARKHREEKPFAIMVADLEAARALVELEEKQAALLASPARPIVLLRRRPGAAVAPSVAPGSALLGVMLPYTPLHHLLLRELGRPLVMTSGNRASEPIAHEDARALEQLSGIADLFLGHDRRIEVRCDDSVVRFDRGDAIPFRRSRGFAPAPTKLPLPLARPTVALGGHLKATFAVGVERDAFLSHHLGDLDRLEAQRAYGDALAHYLKLFRVEPERVVHDLHPDYASTALGGAGVSPARPRARGTPTPPSSIAVQHHHAHMASCMAENGLLGDAIGVAWDGAGLGEDGAIWGGEFLVGGYASVERAAHWAYVPMPGGERAIHEPWRMALAYLLHAGLDVAPLARIDERALGVVSEMCARRVNAPLTSSVGRLFDAVASLVLHKDKVSFEGQAAIELEALASSVAPDGAYPFGFLESGVGVSPAQGARAGRPRHRGPERQALILDPAPLVAAVVADVRAGVAPERIARRFHSTLVDAIVFVVARLGDHAPGDVVLTGGVFMNAILAEEAAARLEALGLRVHRHRQVPPNDGGLSLGQLAVAAGRDALAARS